MNRLLNRRRGSRGNREQRPRSQVSQRESQVSSNRFRQLDRQFANAAATDTELRLDMRRNFFRINAGERDAGGRQPCRQPPDLELPGENRILIGESQPHGAAKRRELPVERVDIRLPRRRQADDIHRNDFEIGVRGDAVQRLDNSRLRQPHFRKGDPDWRRRHRPAFRLEVRRQAQRPVFTRVERRDERDADAILPGLIGNQLPVGLLPVMQRLQHLPRGGNHDVRFEQRRKPRFDISRHHQVGPLRVEAHQRRHRGLHFAVFRGRHEFEREIFLPDLEPRRRMTVRHGRFVGRFNRTNSGRLRHLQPNSGRTLEQ